MSTKNKPPKTPANRGNHPMPGTDAFGSAQPLAAGAAMPHEFDELLEARAAKRPKSKNPLRPDGVGGKVFDFLSSLWLALILLSILGVVCIAGTIYESSYTARLAQRLIYRTAWFDLLIAGIFINVLFATLARFPWPITKTGFLITHLGVLTVLVGGLISHRYGIEGQMMLREGQSKERMQLGTTFIGIQEAGSPVRHRFDAVEVEWGNPSPANPQTYPINDLGLKAVVEGFYPDSEWKDEWRDDGPLPNPAVHFSIDHNTMGRMVEGWLAPNMQENRTQDMGPAVINTRLITNDTALAAELSPATVEATATKGTLDLTLTDSGEAFSVDVDEALKSPVPLLGTDLSVQVTQHFSAGYLGADGALSESPDKSPNPVVIFDVYRAGVKAYERQIEYAFFPDFDMSHGTPEEKPPFESTFRPGSGGAPSRPEFTILIGPGEQLHWKVTDTAGKSSSGTLAPKEPIPMPLMTAGMNLVVHEFFQKAWKEEVLVDKKIKQGEFGMRAAKMKLVNDAGQEASFWQDFFGQQEVKLGDKKYIVSYQNDEWPLGFTVKLKDFRLLHYPGATNRPMSYESDVHVVDHSDSDVSPGDVTILMNMPLDHGGYRIFQSSYQDFPKGDPQISIFSIAHDPGISIIYIGSIILCLGIAVMFYARPYLKKIEARFAAKPRTARAPETQTA